MTDVQAILANLIDPPSMLFTGADPCWTPERERFTAKPLPGSAKGRPVVPEACSECGNGAALMDAETTVHLCASCLRAQGRQAARIANNPVGKPNPKRYGKMAPKMVGKPDVALNAYLERCAMADDAIDPKAPRFRPRGKDKSPAAPPTHRPDVGGMGGVLEPGA